MDRLKGKTALITGGARGMGAATVRLFVAEGARGVITDGLEEEGRQLAASLGEAAVFVRHDVSDEGEWGAAVRCASDTFGGLDVLVNNAGILKFVALEEMDRRDFDRILSVNVTGVFLGIKTASAVMLAQGKGSIVN